MTHAEEQYLRAANSSHLKADEFDGDIDTIIAAGSSRQGLASTLLRLRGEYDAMRGETNHVQALAQQRESDAKNLEARALIEVARSNLGPTRAQFYRDQAAAIRKASAIAIALAHRLIMLRLRTLPIARMLLRNFVVQESLMGLQSLEVDHAVRSVLRAFLMPKCGSCGGRGFNGGHRQPTIRCAECRETGDAAIEWGSLDAELFGRELLHRIDVKVENLRRHMLRRTKGMKCYTR